VEFELVLFFLLLLFLSWDTRCANSYRSFS